MSIFTTISNTAKAGYEKITNLLSDDKPTTSSTLLNTATTTSNKSKYNLKKDYRARLSIAPLQSPLFSQTLYRLTGIDDKTKNGFLKPIFETSGIIFPYTPTIKVAGQVNYQSNSITQTNYEAHTWMSTKPESFSLDAKFVATTPAEARYMLAVITFLRAITKGDTGEKSYNIFKEDEKLGNDAANMLRCVPGLPPPLLYFSAYGDLMINEVPVLINQYSYQLQNNVDYIELLLDTNDWSDKMVSDGLSSRSDNTISCHLPTEIDLSLSLLTAPNPHKMRKEFNIWEFKTGKLLKNGTSGWTM
jgi:hypothetical protein